MSTSSKPRLDTTRFIARHVAGLRRSGIRDFFELVAKTDGVISLGIGEPDFDTPQPIRDAVTTAMNTGKTHYTSNMGLPALRAEISRYAEGHFKVSYRPDDEVLVTVGVSEGLDLTLRSLLNPGDKVMYHQPCYVSYAPSVDLVHAVGVPVATHAGDLFSLDAPALAAADVGMAMANPDGGGTDVAMHAAGITLMRGDPLLVAAALDISARTVRKIRQNLFWAFAYNVAGIPLAALGFLNPVFAGAAMAMSSVSVMANALLLKRWKP